MIDPLLQVPLPPRAGEGAKADQGPGDDVFAQILAAGGAPAPRFAGPPPMPDHGPAIVRAPVEGEASVLDPIPQPAGSPCEEMTLAAAEVFNEDGFFGAPIAGEPGHEVRSRAGETPRSRQIAEIEPPSAMTIYREADPSLTAGAKPGTSPSSLIPGLRLPNPVSGATATHMAGIATPSRVVPETVDAAERVEPVMRRFTMREPAARGAVQVVLRELEHGLHISARTDALDASERIRLQDEIAALLARHGLAPRGIRISAPVRSALSQEKFK